jgi:hypothetical protein
MNAHFWPVWNPAPPRPRKPLALIFEITPSGVIVVRALRAAS